MRYKWMVRILLVGLVLLVATMMGAAGKGEAAGGCGDSVPEPGGRPAAHQGQLSPLTMDSVRQGPDDAPVTIVQYTDFQCPYCATSAQVMAEVLAKYDGNVRLVLKHYPLDFHEYAMGAALYFEAIAIQDMEKAWQFYSRVFQQQSRLKEGEGFLKQTAAEVGADLRVLAADLAAPSLKARIRADMREAERFGIDGVPSFIINGTLLSGALPLEEFSKVIDEALNVLAQ